MVRAAGRFVLLLLLVAGWSLPAAAQEEVQASGRVRKFVVIRAEPSASSAQLDALEPGERLLLEESLPGWNKVKLPDGRSGYVSKSWTKVLAEVAAYLVHVIDVGTGLAVFVEGPGFTLLYDGGSNDDKAMGAKNRLVAYLKAVRPGLATIDHLVLSHPHNDHVSLLPDLLAEYAVRNVWDSGRTYETCAYRVFLEGVAAEPGILYHDAVPGPAPRQARFGPSCAGRRTAGTIVIPKASTITSAKVPLGSSAGMTFLHRDGQSLGSPNGNSLVMRLDLGNARLLFMGDAEAGEREPPSHPPRANSVEGKLLDCCEQELRAEVLISGHHGSSTSSRRKLLDAVGANIFVISSGPYKYSGTALPDEVVRREYLERGRLFETNSGDPECKTNMTKIGPDGDGRPGGCENIHIRISGSVPPEVHYFRTGD